MEIDSKKKILVQCDFDGTITEKDVSILLLDAFAEGDWQAVNKDYMDGKITVGKFNETVFGMVKASKEVMLDYIKDRAIIREGFQNFVVVCEEMGIRIVIVSNGLDFYIKKILKDHKLGKIEYHAAETRFHPDGLKVKYIGPDGTIVDSGFKDKYVDYHLQAGYQVIYIGDGTSDLSAARNCHQVFATENLLGHCRRTGLDCIPFSSFVEITQVLNSW